MLIAPFTIIDIVHNKQYKMQYNVGFVGCDQNDKNEIFPVMEWSVLPYEGLKKNYFYYLKYI